MSEEISAQPHKPRPRDQRLDLARGVMLLIIFVAHVPNNLWADYIPARFGFSSGAEIFVFVSGIASGLAFGGTFLKKGFYEGSRRIFKRIVQLYSAHIIMLLTLGFAALALDSYQGNNLMAVRYDLEFLRDTPASALFAYATLRYVPAFFDILPMYTILLALVVPAMVASRVSPWLVLGASALLWLTIWILRFNLGGHPVTGASWYFNPFAWQFLFFIGFSFGVGWLKAPPRNQPLLLSLAILVLVVSVPLTGWIFYDSFSGALNGLNELIYPPDAITIAHYTRIVHFLSLAYVCYSLVNPKAEWLSHPRLKPLYRIGRNSFSCFLAGVALSMAGGVAIDLLGMSWMVAHVVNIAGIILLLLIAWGLEAFDKRDGKTISQAAQSPASTVSDDRRESARVA
ncbi:MAG: OpgC family protein [Beijerinckiaceae bacterium]